MVAREDFIVNRREIFTSHSYKQTSL